MLPTLALLGRALIECLNWIIDGVPRMGSDHFKRFHHNVPETHQWHIRWGSIHLEESPGQTHVPGENLAVSLSGFNRKMIKCGGHGQRGGAFFQQAIARLLPVSPTWNYLPTHVVIDLQKPVLHPCSWWLEELPQKSSGVTCKVGYPLVN